MPEIPASWGLKERRTEAGKLQLIGKDNAGHDYIAHSSDRPAVTDETLRELARGDREKTTPREFVSDILAEHARAKADFESRATEDIHEATEEVMRGAWSSGGGERMGYTSKYASGFQLISWEED